MTTYVLDNAWRDARRRLRHLEEALDPASTRRLRALGVGPGWRCLDVGAGGGSIAQWLCSEVGVGGRVVAIDLDTRFLDGLNEPNLEVRQVDVVSGQLEKATFDLVRARGLLVHLPARTQVLEKMLASLRPGGWLLLEEPAAYPVTATASGIYLEAFEAFLRTWAAAGGDGEWAQTIPQRLHERRLDRVDSEVVAEPFQGGSTWARFWQVTWDQLREPMLRGGLSADVLDAVMALLDRPEHSFPNVAVVSAWGQRTGQ